MKLKLKLLINRLHEMGIYYKDLDNMATLIRDWKLAHVKRRLPVYWMDSLETWVRDLELMDEETLDKRMEIIQTTIKTIRHFELESLAEDWELKVVEQAMREIKEVYPFSAMLLNSVCVLIRIHRVSGRPAWTSLLGGWLGVYIGRRPFTSKLEREYDSERPRQTHQNHKVLP